MKMKMLSWLISGDYPGTGTLVFWTVQVIAVLSILLWVYNHVSYKQSFWARNGIPGPKPIFLLGTDIPFGLKPWAEIATERYRKYGKIYGGYQLLHPVLTIQDADIAKQIMIKDFPSFLNRQTLPTYHELFNQNMFFSQNEKWKRMRTIASPSFASGKLRHLSPLMHQCIGKLFEYFDRIIDANRDGLGAVIATKEVISGFTMDVIARTSFSTDTHSNEVENRDQHPFMKHGLGLFRINIWRGLAVNLLPPPILKLMGIKLLNSPEAFDYFVNLTRAVIRQRKNLSATGGKPPHDLLQMILDAEVDESEMEEQNLNKLTAQEEEQQQHQQQQNQKPNKGIMKKLTESEVIANCIIFFVAGFETTASTISHCMFQLAWHPEVQERLYQDLMKALDGKEPDSQEYFEIAMTGTPYFEAVVKETLRTFPPVTILNRCVTVDEYDLNGVKLPRGTWIRIAAHVMHHMEEYYDKPNEFRPERWLPPERDSLHPYAYLPFGMGPRNCIGMRFAYQEIRLTLARIITRYRLDVAPDTPRKLSSRPRSPLLATNSFNLKISRR